VMEASSGDPGMPASGQGPGDRSPEGSLGAEDVSGGGSGSAQPSQEELRARLEEQLRNLRVEDLMVESVVSVLNLTARRIAKEDERDLEQGKVGIDAIRAWVDLLPKEAADQIRQALSELQVLYAQAAEAGKEAGQSSEQPAGGGDTPGREAEDVSRADSGEQSTQAELSSADSEGEAQDEEDEVATSTAHDWLSEVSDDADGETMEWPAPAGDTGEVPEWRQGEEDEEPLTEPRIRHLFPVPEEGDWDVGELEYDRSRTRVS
jgi:hypothetical protein